MAVLGSTRSPSQYSHHRIRYPCRCRFSDGQHATLSWLGYARSGIDLLVLVGMVLNDVNDVEVDREQRRNRPLTRGDISVATARRFGWLLIATALAATFCSATFARQQTPAVWTPLLIASTLALAIVVYDSGLKTQPFAPWVMGLCRGLNILLGASLGLWTGMALIDWLSMPHLWMTAVGHCIYVAGLTIAARREALTSSRFFVSAGWALSGVGCIC